MHLLRTSGIKLKPGISASIYLRAAGGRALVELCRIRAGWATHSLKVGTSVHYRSFLTHMIFVEKRSLYGLRSCDNLQLPQARTTCNGLDTISFRGCRLWQALPNDIKQSNTLSSFKSRIKLWKGEECNCRICRPFVAQVGFLS